MSSETKACRAAVDEAIQLLAPFPIQVSPLIQQLLNAEATAVNQLIMEAKLASKNEKQLILRMMWKLGESYPDRRITYHLNILIGVVWSYRTFSTADHLSHITSREILHEVRKELIFGKQHVGMEKVARFAAPMAFVKCMDINGEPSYQELEWLEAHLKQLASYAKTIRARGRWDHEFLTEVLDSKAPSLSEGML